MTCWIKSTNNKMSQVPQFHSDMIPEEGVEQARKHPSWPLPLWRRQTEKALPDPEVERPKIEKMNSRVGT